MKKLTYEGWVTSFVERLSDHMNLAGWTITVEFMRSNKEGQGDTYAEMDVKSVYMFAHMRVYPQGKRDFKSGNMILLVNAIVHEMVHIFLDPFLAQMQEHLSKTTTPFFMDILEQQTQKLAMVLVKTLPPSLIPSR